METGRLVIRLAWRGGRVCGVAGQTLRPEAARLLRGKTPAEAQALVPLLFSLCGKAQQAVCGAACAAASGRVLQPSPAQRRALIAEAGQEHLWRLLLDWPRLLGVPPAEAAFARGYRGLAAWTRGAPGAPSAPTEAASKAVPADAVGHGGGGSVGDLGAFAGFLQDTLLGGAAPDFLAGRRPADDGLAGQLLAALPSSPPLGEMRPRLLPRRTAADWAQDPALAAAGFAMMPRWAGRPAETGALARQQDRPAVAVALADGQLLRARLLARLCDVAELAAGLDVGAGGGALATDRAAAFRVDRGAAPVAWAGDARGIDAVWLDAASSQPGCGLACTDTARGLLIHQVRLEAGRIADYLVVAPSEWNFHPAGLWRQELEGLPVATPGAAEARARLLALALDPCVPLHLEVNATENDHA